MNQQEKLAAAKKSCLARFGEIFQDFEIKKEAREKKKKKTSES